MNAPPVLPEKVPTPEQTLRRLFLTLFLRGRSSRGLKKSHAPTSIGNKLALTLIFYALFGCMAFMFTGQPVFVLSAYLSGMTFAFLGMFVAASAGEILFNKEEADILMHRPVTPKVLLWSKIRVLVEVSLWLGGAFNLVGLAVGGFSKSGDWRYPLVHAISVVMEALFCTGGVVLVYQLCLRWFGRERLDGLMTTMQVLVAIGAMAGSQILPRIMFRVGNSLTLDESTWWLTLLPPAWFAGLDDAVAGTGQARSWQFAALAFGMTTLVLWLAFGRLANSYATGLRSLNESVSPSRKEAGRRRWLSALVQMPPLSWWLREPVSRASFLLTAAYMLRDRDVKLRLYPGLAPMLVMPFVFMLQGVGGQGAGGLTGFGIAISGAYLGMAPLMGLNLLQYSQQWQAADIFRCAPMAGPAPLCHGARRAVLLILTLPLALVFGGVALLIRHNLSELFLLLPGLVALPVYALIPSRLGRSVPLSVPTEEAKSAGRGLWMMLAMFTSMGLGGLALVAQHKGWFWWFLLAETAVAAVVYTVMRRTLDRLRWTPAE